MTAPTQQHRAPRPRFSTTPTQAMIAPPATAGPAAIALAPTMDWPQFWEAVRSDLRARSFQTGTLLTYRQVLRSFKTFIEERRKACGCALPSRPAETTSALAESYLASLAEREISWSWRSTVTSVLRTAFDKLGGKNITAHLRTPKRPDRLGEIVTEAEAARMIEQCPTLRDRLIIGLLFGCGLKVGELCVLRWADVDPQARELTVHFDAGTRHRTLPLPEALVPVLAEGVKRCAPEEYIFVGGKPGAPLHRRSAERIVSRAARDAGLLKEICCTSLRNGYAVSRLRRGENIRSVQEALGHKQLATTMRYQRWILPDCLNPADQLDLPETRSTAPSTTATSPQDPNPQAKQVARLRPAMSRRSGAKTDPGAANKQAHNRPQKPERLSAYQNFTSQHFLPSLPASAFQDFSLSAFSSLSNGSSEFYAKLKSRLTKGFLALRRFAGPAPPRAL